MDKNCENINIESHEEIYLTNDAFTVTEDMFAVIEACLFAAGHPLTYDKLAEVLSVTPSRCADIVEKMSVVYNNESNHRGIILVRFPDSCQLCTKECYGEQIKTALGIRRGGNLSQSLLEVLAVVAYNQPTTRAFVDTVRGVDSSYAMNALQEKNMIEACGKLDAPGKPTLFKTTNDFLRVFGLSSIEELPVVTVKSDSGEEIEFSSENSEITTDFNISDDASGQDSPEKAKNEIINDITE